MPDDVHLGAPERVVLMKRLGAVLGVDLSHHEPATLNRRLAHRMVATGSCSLDDDAARLEPRRGG